MVQYRYRGTNEEHHPVEGTLEAASARDVVDILRLQEIYVSAVELVQPAPRIIPRKTALSSEDLALFNEQLLAIVNSGLPLAPSLEALAHDVQSWRLKSVLERVRLDVEKGLSLSDALARHPHCFSPVYLSVIRAGEAAGNLSSALLALSEYSARGMELRYRLQEALAYPLLVFFVASAVLLYFLIQIVPSMHGMGVFHVPVITGHESIPQSLPLPTRIVLTLSAFLRNNGIALAIVAVVAVAALVVVLRVNAVRSGPRPALDRWKLRVPLFGMLFYEASMAQFVRSFGMLLASHLPLPDSLRLASAASGNDALREAGWRAAERVESGRPLSDSLEESGYFQHTFYWLMRTSEERGDMEKTLTNLAEAYERKAERRSRRIVATSGPAVTLMAAAVVVILMLSIYLPMLSNAFGWLFNSGEVISG